MRKIWTKSSKRRSISTISKSKNPDSLLDISEADSAERTLAVRALIVPNYDTDIVRHAWINGILNSSPSQDFAELNLQLYRVELRGSFLYIHRPPPQLGVRLLRVNTKDSMALGYSDSSTFASASDLNSVFASKSILGHDSLPPESPLDSDFEPPKYFKAADQASTHSSNSTLPLQDLQLTADPASKNNSSSSRPREPDVEISYYEPRIPHPNLNFDFDSMSFLPNSSTESLVHFFLFADATAFSGPVQTLISVFPLFSRFLDVLRFMLLMLKSIYRGEFGEVMPDVAHRVIAFFHHLDLDFSGFLLKSDLAPEILKILELITENLDASQFPEIAASLADFKASMLAKQHLLLDLVKISDSANAPLSPLSDLSSSIFLEDLNLVDLAKAIGEIDTQFFEKWNSSKDKSLLLHSSLSEATSGDYFYKKNPLLFNNDTHIHYLSRLLVHHLFLESTTMYVEQRARILEKWIDLGCLLDKSGNMSSWLGISSVILSQPILRLKNVWAHVSENYLTLLKNDWAPVLFELDRRHLANSYESLSFGNSGGSGSEVEVTGSKESYHIMAPRGLGKIYPKEAVVPYFGDLLVNNTQSTSIPELDIIWKKINYSFDRWNDYLKNLYNSPDIISYNQDVIRRYDSMGFIFSNESLNQVLYLGIQKDDSLPPNLNSSGLNSVLLNSAMSSSGSTGLKSKLMRLLELNCDSINLDTIMKYSLASENSSAENYLKGSTKVRLSLSNGSSLSVNSMASLHLVETNDTNDLIQSNKTSAEGDVEDRLPAFNNKCFKINLQKYDDLVATESSNSDRTKERHNIVVDNDLVLRIDDFITDYESDLNASEDHTNQDEDDGLGIDVDDILNSDKFKNFSITEESDAASSDRKHRSFGMVSNHSQADVAVRTRKYIPKFASVDKLVDLLLIDSKHFDKNHPIDLTEYRLVFMLNYSTFISTKGLLEKLAHRFIHSGNAVISVMKKYHLVSKGNYDPTAFGVYPNWEVDEQVNLSDLGEVDYELLLKIQVNILKALIILVNNYFESFSNDLKNKKIMIKLLKLYSNEILQWYNSNKIDGNLSKAFENLVNFYKRLKKLFVKKSYRPIESLKFDKFLIHEFKFNNSMRDVPMNRNLPSPRNIHKIEKFLNKFNKLLSVFYRGISAENWFCVFKILENLYENYSLLNYNMQDADTSEELLKVSNIFGFLETLYDADPKDPVLRKFPLVFRKLCRLYMKFKSYLLVQLCDANISVDERLDRMKTLLLMVKISRIKMGENLFVFEGYGNEIPSCIESALKGAIYSPESRSFHQLWLKASAELEGSDFTRLTNNKTCDYLGDLLPTNLVAEDLLMPHEPLLPCFGWIIQNLIDINKCPSFHRHHINFNKRYFIFKLIKELSVEDSDEMEDIHNEIKEFEFLLKLDESSSAVAHLPSTGEKGQRVFFRGILRDQHVLLQGEAKKRAAKDQKGQVVPIHKTQIVRKTSTNSLRRQSINYKTSSSSRFKISGLFNKSRSNAAAQDRIASYSELPEPGSVADPRQKPVAVVQLKNTKTFPVYLFPFSFKVDPEDTNEVFFFQTISETDTKDWLNALDYANRHWFYSRTINYKVQSHYTSFGLPLSAVCARDKTDSPKFLQLIYQAIEREGLQDVGIYRISTSISELNSIKLEIDRTGGINLDERGVNVHALTSCVKLYFRELPDALLTDEVIEALVPLKKVGDEFSEADAQAYRTVLARLPVVNYQTLKALIKHLSEVVRHNEVNKMTTSNLATVIGPALTEASNLEALINNFGVLNHVLEKFIDQYQVLFTEPAEVAPLSNVPELEVASQN